MLILKHQIYVVMLESNEDLLLLWIPTIGNQDLRPFWGPLCSIAKIRWNFTIDTKLAEPPKPTNKRLYLY